jgi:hypothetical protein
MSAAATNARMRKHSAQMQAMAMLPTSGAPCCSVCESGKRSEQAAPRQLSRCAYCEKLMGECCSRECEGCSNQFCSLCTTLKYVIRALSARRLASPCQHVTKVTASFVIIALRHEQL